MTRPRPRALPAVLLLAVGAASLGVTGCKVKDDDVHRWETTKAGPEKLRAVLYYDKYDTGLRVESAMSLIRMKPRQGRRVGIEILVKTLGELSPESRQAIVAQLVPAVVAEMKKPPPVAQANQPLPPDPSVPFKDAAYSMLTADRSAIIQDEALKQQIRVALVEWSMADFEHRLDNKQQMFGMEQVLRYLGAPGVVGLPKLMTRDAIRIEQMASLVAELGDTTTKDGASAALVKIAQFVGSDEWTKMKKPDLEARNKASGVKSEGQAFETQLKEWQTEELLRTFGSMKKVGGRPMVDFLLGFAADKTQSDKRRQGALAALEGRLDRNNPEDINKILAIAGADAPDIVLDQAFRRVGEMPRDKVAEKIYGIFKTDKWKVRRAAAMTLLRMSTMKHVDEFLSKLPEGEAKGFSMAEPIGYGAGIGDLKEGDPREALKKYLATGQPAQRATAVGFYFTHGTPADFPTLQPLEADGQKMPVCETDAECKWSCEVPKEGGKPEERESKEVKTLGDFVKYCVEPAVKARAAEKKDEKKDDKKDPKQK